MASGMSEGEALASALDFDLSCMWFGRWVEAREKATKEVKRPKKQRDTIQVPRYTTRKQYLGIVEGMAETTEHQEGAATRPDLDARVQQFRADPDALMAFLREE